MLARAGARVTLIERDALSSDGPARDAFAWERKGIPHFLQPHAFTPRGRNELRTHMPDVYETLLREGADEIDMWPRIPGGRPAGEDDMIYLAIRRPFIEWALRHAVQAEASIHVVGPARAVGITFEGRVTGLRLDDGSTFACDLVIDAMGRTSSMQAWLEAHGVKMPAPTSAECGSLYYSRYYRLRPGRAFPDGPWLVSPRAELGYAGCATFYGDDRTFATAFFVPTQDADLRIIRDARAYDAVLANIPVISSLVDPEMAEPITGVLPMGNLQNTYRTYAVDGEPIVAGVIPVADAICHTNPAFALGLSLSVAHAGTLGRIITEHPNDVRDAAAAFFAASEPEMIERHAMATELDAVRARMMRGEKIDPTTPKDSAAMFVAFATGILALKDAEIGRRALRRWGFLDPLSAIDGDEVFMARLQTEISAFMQGQPPAARGPAREELLQAARAAVGSAEPPKG